MFICEIIFAYVQYLFMQDLYTVWENGREEVHVKEQNGYV